MSEFEFRTMSADDADRRRRELRSGAGGRKSKYSPVGEKLTSLGDGQVLCFNVAPNQIIRLRNYVARNFGDRFRVASRRVSEEQFEVHIAPTDGAAPKRRGGRKKAAG